MSHPNIIKMREAFYNKTKETIYLVMDLVDGVTLKKYLKDCQDLSEIGGLPENVSKMIFV